MIKLKSLISEIVDGRGYFTKEKFGSIVLAELQRAFPGFAHIELVSVYDGQEFKQEKRRGMRHNRDMKSLSDRNAIYNSVLMGVYSIEYNDKEYEVRIVNTFKKVPDEELSNRFTMADDEYLKKMAFKSLEPKDLNKSSGLMRWQCNVKRDDKKVLIPKKTGYAILFDDYKTLKDAVDDVKKVIEKDSGFGGDSNKPTNVPVTPNMQIAEAILQPDKNPNPEVTQEVNSVLKDIKQLQYDLGFTNGVKIIYVIDKRALARYVKITNNNIPVFTISPVALTSYEGGNNLKHEIERVLVHELGHAYLDLMEVDSIDRNVLDEEETAIEEFAQSFVSDRNVKTAKQILDSFVESFEFKHGLNESRIPIYRGVSEYNKKYDSFYTTKKEWARNFTQSGLDREIKRAFIDTDVIYKANPLTRATSDKDFDRDIPAALESGYKALWVNEGQGEPPSIYIIDKTALL